MTDLDRMQAILEQERTTQGFNAVPVHLNSTGLSGLSMGNELGVAYQGFLGTYRAGWAEFNYVVDDFRRIWSLLKSRWNEDAHYFSAVRNRHTETFRQFEDWLKRDLRNRLADLNDRSLLDRLRDARLSNELSCGVAHLIEAIVHGATKELRTTLTRDGISDRELDRFIATVTEPTQRSFVAEANDLLASIAPLTGTQRSAAIGRYLDRFSWIGNSYAGRVSATVETVEEELRHHVAPSVQPSAPSERPTLSPPAKTLADLLAFMASWQDTRKAFILQGIDYLAQVLDEVAKRTALDRSLLDYLSITEITSAHALSDITQCEPQLSERVQACWVLIGPSSDTFVTGQVVAELDRLNHRSSATHATELHGNTAQPGKITGPVARCLSLEAIANFPAGAVLVTSMTRPEFMPAIRRAAAIVTDEGGITCHAAIVARELGKPCIIGTKVATKVLRDGELVEVNANHGIVRRVKG